MDVEAQKRDCRREISRVEKVGWFFNSTLLGGFCKCFYGNGLHFLCGEWLLKKGGGFSTNRLFCQTFCSPLQKTPSANGRARR